MPKSTRATAGTLKGWEEEIVRWRQQGYPIKRTTGNNGKPAKEGIIDMPKAEGINATFAQIELVLRNKGERKYISGSDWAKILRRINLYESTGVQCSVTIDDIRYDKSKLKRKRRDYHRDLEDLERREVENTDLPRRVEVQIEHQAVHEAATEDAEAGDDTTTAIADDDQQLHSSPPQTATILDTNEVEELRINLPRSNHRLQEPHDQATQSLAETEFQLILSPSYQNIPLYGTEPVNNFSPDINFDQSSYISDVSLTSIFNPGPTSLFHPGSQITSTSRDQALTLGNGASFEVQTIIHDSSAPLSTFSHNFDIGNTESMNLGLTHHGLFNHGGQCSTLLNLWQEIPNVSPEHLAEFISIFSHQELTSDIKDARLLPQKIRSSLASLLPSESLSIPYSDSVALSQGINSALHRLLIFEIENNFSSCLDTYEMSTVLKIIRQHPQLQLKLKGYLLQGSRSKSINLAGALVKAAIENCDAATVAEILSLKLLDVNKLVCTCGGRRYTAVELSAALRSLQVTKELIAAGADVNRTVEAKKHLAGALDNALTLRIYTRENTPPETDLVHLIIQAGGKIQERTLELASFWKIDELTTRVLSEILSSQHQLAFDAMLIDRTSDSFARIWIKRIFQSCFQSGCGKCPKSKSRTVESWVESAIKKGLADIVEFLMPHVTDLAYIFTRAVRYGQEDIVELFLRRGADVGCYTRIRDKDRPSTFIWRDYSEIPPLGTPLAEAILSGNKTLIRRFESLGAFDHIPKTTEHLQAALNGAAGAGDLFHLQKILHMVSHADSETLGVALSLAILGGHDKASMLLLNKRADVNCTLQGFPALPIYYAIEHKNAMLVREILDRDVDKHHDSFHDILKVIRWGELSVVKDMVATFGLPSPCLPEIEHTLLSVAINNKDMNMFQYLVDSGSNLADSSAFIAALEDKIMFHKLLAMFHEKYPRRVQGFGSEVLREVILRNDMELLEALLAAGFDINGIESSHTSCLEAAMFKRCRNSLEVVRRLLCSGADPNGIVFRPRQGKGLYVPQMTSFLQTIDSKRPDLVMLLIEAGADIHRPARLGVKRTPLQQACEVGSMEIVNILLEMGANPNEPPAIRGGGTSLQLCAIGGYCGIAERLLKVGADVRAKAAEGNGRTALQGAAEHGRFHMLQLLWAAAGSEGFEWEECNRAMRLAEKNGYVGCRDLIQDLYTRGQGHIGFP